MTPRDGQAPPPDHVDKPLAEDGADALGTRITGVADSKDPDGLITVDHEHGQPDPDFTADGASS